MNISVSISLAPGDTAPASTPEELLTALGGDPEKDSINVSISSGSYPPPPPAPEVPAP